MALQCYRPTDPRSVPVRAPDADDGAEERDECAVRCAACGHELTTESAIIEVGGQSDHTFFNPAGVIFEIRCFARAPGCEVLGDPTTEFSWFPGHAWSYALCGGCGDHLGWRFEGGRGPSAFLGLILRKLAE